MKEIFTEEFKQFLKEHDWIKTTRRAKDLETRARYDPRWNPDVVKTEYCINKFERGSVFVCCIEELNSFDICEGEDKCRLLREKNKFDWGE